MQEWYTRGGKGALFRELSSIQECHHRGVSLHTSSMELTMCLG